MEENVFRKARKNAAKREPRLNSCDSAQEIVWIERSRLLKIENGQIDPNPDEVVRMATAYHAPELCPHYCATMCEAGRFMNYQKPECATLSDVATPLMSALYFLEQTNDTIFRIFEDRRITEDEKKDFVDILVKLQKISNASDALKLWAKKQGLITE